MSLPTFAMTYVVYWPEQGVLKVGRAWRFHRVQMMVRSGGHIVVLARGTDWTWEHEALKTLRRWFPRAFARAEDSTDLLFMGRGFTECFTVDEHHLQLAVDLCFEGFARGNDQGTNYEETSESDQAGPVDGSGPARGSRTDTTDGHGPVGSGRRRGQDGTPIEPARRGDLPGRPVDDTGADRDAPAAARRVRIPDDLPVARPHVGAAVPTVAHAAPAPVGMPATTCSGTFRKLPGCGGSAGAGGRTGESRGRRAGERMGDVGGRARESTQAATPAFAAGCPAHRMPRTPSRQIQGLRPLRYSTPPPRQVGSRAAVHRERRRLRAGAGRTGGVG